MRRTCTLLLLLPFLAAHAQRVNPDTASIVNGSSRLQTLAPIEVRAIRAGADAPFAKTELDGAALQKDNLGQDLPVLLQYTPSAVVTSDAGAGVGYTGLRIRGTDATRINVTLNGIPVNDAESQATYFVDLPDLASSTTSIQIERGVGSSTNGAGAFGATVSIASLGVWDKPGAEASVSYGSFNTQKYTVQAGTGYIGDFAMNVRLSQISSDGYIERSASLLQSLQLNAVYKIGRRTTLRGLLLQGVETTHQAWDGVPQDSLATHRTYNELGYKGDGTYYGNQIDHYRQNYYQLFADFECSHRTTLHLGLFLTRGIGYYEEYHNDQSLSDYGLPPVALPGGDTIVSTNLIRQLWLDNYNYGAVYSLLWNAGDQTKITFGGAASQYQGENYGIITWAQAGVPDHYQYYRLDAQKNDFNVYGKIEQHIGKDLLLYGDAQLRTIGYFMNGFRNNPDLRPAVTYLFFNPKAGFTYRFPSASSATRQKIYASFALANHEPNRDDFEANTATLPVPERLLDWEGGYEISRKTWNAGANGYYMDYHNALLLTGQVNDVGAYTRVNVPQSYRAGVELQASWKPLPWLVLAGNSTFSQNKIAYFTEYLDNYDLPGQIAVQHHNTDIAFSPSVIASGSVAFMPFARKLVPNDFTIEVLGKYVGRQYLDNTGNDARSVAAYGLCDVRLRYHPGGEGSWAHTRLGFTLALNNVLNATYASNGFTYPYYSGGAPGAQNYYFPQAGFNWLLGVQVKL